MLEPLEVFSKPAQFWSDEKFDTAARNVVDLLHVMSENNRLDVSDIKSWFGQTLNLWPESVRLDLDAEYHREREARHTRISDLMPSPQIVPAAAALSLAGIVASAARSRPAASIVLNVETAPAAPQDDLSDLAGYSLDEIINGIDHIK